MAEAAYFGETLKSGSGQLAASDLSTTHFYAVTVGSSGVSLVATQGAAGVKVLTNKPAQGDPCALVDIGETKAIAGAAITKGARVMTDTSGRFIPYVNANGQVAVGEARMAASNAGDIITIWLYPHRGAGGLVSGTASGDLVPTGSTRADALALTADENFAPTVSSGTGVILPAAALGLVVFVGNGDGSNALKVYAAGSDTINGTAGSTGISLAATKNAVFFCPSAAKWRMILTA